MIFVDHPNLLKRLVAVLLGISLESIEEFSITNPEIPPDYLGEKFCRLDINMVVNGQRVDLEVQVTDKNDYPERSLYYWAREYSSTLSVGDTYSHLPRVIVINIVAFKLFKRKRYHSEYQVLEVIDHAPLTDRLSIHYFELPKLSKQLDKLTGCELWLALLNAKTEEDLTIIEALGVTEVTETIQAYRKMTASEKFHEMERLRAHARINEASALRHAREVAIAKNDKKWQGVVADKDAALADKDAAIADKDAALAEQAAMIAELLAKIGESNN
jgi:predicted transposase/invertase (TIGR01784 family)